MRRGLIRRVATTALIAVVGGVRADATVPVAPGERHRRDDSSPEPTPTQAPTPVVTAPPGANSPSPSPSVRANPATVALVPSSDSGRGTTGISRAELRAALVGRGAIGHVLVAGSMPGGHDVDAGPIRAAVERDPRTLGLLPADEVTATSMPSRSTARTCSGTTACETSQLAAARQTHQRASVGRRSIQP